jgi:hypothetical protein
MKSQDILIAQPANAAELGIIKAFFEALKIKFEVTQKSPYNPEFVAKIRQSEKEFAEGKAVKMSISEFKDLCK